MSYRTRTLILYSLAACIPYLLTGTTASRPTGSVNCDKLDKPDWSVDSLTKEKLALWPWSCLNSRPIKASLKETIYDRTKIENNSINRHSIVHRVAAFGLVEAVRFFIDVLNYPVDVRNAQNETPSHAAAEYGHLPVLKYLIEEKGADVNATNEDGETLLHFATDKGRLDVVKWLVDQKGMSVDAKSVLNETPLLLAVMHGKLDVVKYLVDGKKTNLNVKELRPWGPGGLLHCAVYSANLNLVKYLVDDAQMSTLIDEVNWSGRTAAMEAANWGHLDIFKFLVGERHANTTITDKTGQNVLHTAALRGQLPIVKYLIEEKGFDVNSKTRGGDTTYELTKRNGFLYAPKKRIDEVLEYLQTKME